MIETDTTRNGLVSAPPCVNSHVTRPLGKRSGHSARTKSLMHFHFKQSWSKALRGALYLRVHINMYTCKYKISSNPGLRPARRFLRRPWHPSCGTSTCTRFSARCSFFYLFSKNSVNPLTILCALGVPRLNYTCFLATETNLFPALSLQLVPPYARPNSLSFACGNLTLAHVQARCKS